jgi:hypothetical protein
MNQNSQILRRCSLLAGIASIAMLFNAVEVQAEEVRTISSATRTKRAMTLTQLPRSRHVSKSAQLLVTDMQAAQASIQAQQQSDAGKASTLIYSFAKAVIPPVNETTLLAQVSSSSDPTNATHGMLGVSSQPSQLSQLNQPGTTPTTPGTIPEGPTPDTATPTNSIPGMETPDTTTPGTTPPGTAPGTITPDTTTPGTTTPDTTTPGTTTPDTTPPTTPTPRTTPDPGAVNPGRATRSGASYVGIGGNIGIGDGDTQIGESSFALISKVGLLPYASVRPSIFFSDDVTILLPVTYDFSFGAGGTDAVRDTIGLRVAPYVGAGLAISTGDDADVGLLLTGGLDIPLTSRFTLNGAVNASVTGNPAVGLLLGVGYNF